MKKAKILGALLAGVMAVTGLPVIPSLSTPLSVVSEAASKLAAPKNVKATANGTTVKLSWNAVSGADAYRVYQLDSASGEYKKVKNVSGTSTSIKNLSKGTYKFKVAALVKSGSSLKVQTKSSAVSAKVTGKTSSSSSASGLIKFPAFGTTGKKAAEAMGLKDYQYVEQEKEGVKVGAYAGTVKFGGADCTVVLLVDKKGTYFAGAIVMDQNATTFANAYKLAKNSLGKPTMDMSFMGMEMYMWMIEKTQEIYTIMGADMEGNSMTIYYALSYTYAPDEMKKGGSMSSFQTPDLSSILTM